VLDCLPSSASRRAISSPISPPLQVPANRYGPRAGAGAAPADVAWPSSSIVVRGLAVEAAGRQREDRLLRPSARRSSGSTGRREIVTVQEVRAARSSRPLDGARPPPPLCRVGEARGKCSTGSREKDGGRGLDPTASSIAATCRREERSLEIEESSGSRWAPPPRAPADGTALLGRILGGAYIWSSAGRARWAPAGIAIHLQILVERQRVEPSVPDGII